MARGDVARLCRVGEGSTSSGRNSGSSAKRSSKYTSDSTLPDQRAQNNRWSINTLDLLFPPPSKALVSNASTHLSTESKVFFRGGGRALTFLGATPSFSVCGGGRLGSVAGVGGRGDEGRDSFHPAFSGREQ